MTDRALPFDFSSCEIRVHFLLPNTVTESAQCRVSRVSWRNAMAAPASDRTSGPKPGFYWLRQQDESGRARKVVQVYRRRKQLRIHFLATDVDKSLKKVEAAGQTLGPEARVSSARSARSTTAASG